MVIVYSNNTITTVLNVLDPFKPELDTIENANPRIKTLLQDTQHTMYTLSWDGVLISVTATELATIGDPGSDHHSRKLTQLRTVKCLASYFDENKRARRKLLNCKAVIDDDIIDGSKCSSSITSTEMPIVFRWLWQKKVELELLADGYQANLSVPSHLENSHVFWQSLGITTKLRLSAFKLLLKNEDMASLIFAHLKLSDASNGLSEKYKLAALLYCLHVYYPSEFIVNPAYREGELSSFPVDVLSAGSFTFDFISNLPKPRLELKPAVEVMNLDGNSVEISSLMHGSLILLDFWGTWCKPCLQDAPKLDSLATIMSSHGHQIISIAIDEEKKWRRHLQNSPASSVTHVLSRTEQVLSPAPIAFPTYVLVNSNGEVVSVAFHDIENAIAYLTALYKNDD